MRPQIVLFGDSITECAFTLTGNGGWGAQLAKTYSRKADVIVRGYSGYNTRLALLLLDRIFPLESSTPPIATTVFFGGDDATLPGSSSHRQHVPVEEYKENLRKIVSHLKECSPKMLVVLITPLPVDEEARLNYARRGSLQQRIRGLSTSVELPDRTNANTRLYAQGCLNLARELRLPCVNLWKEMQETENWQKELLSYDGDGPHLTYEGNYYVHQAVLGVLRDRGLNSKLMPIDFPLAADIDLKDPEKCFQR